MTKLLDQIENDIKDVFVTDFATPFVWKGSTVQGIFDDAFKAVNVKDQSIETIDPQITCAAVDVPGIIKGDTLTLSGTNYYVIGIQPDGTGMITIGLSKVEK